MQHRDGLSIVTESDVFEGSEEEPVLSFQTSALDVMRERERILVSALQHYAEPCNWGPGGIYRGFCEAGTELAQAALEELGLR